MKRPALFFAISLAVAAVGTAGAAIAQVGTATAASTDAAPTTGAAKPDRPQHDRNPPFGHRARGGAGHAFHGGIERMDTDGDGRVSRAEFDTATAAFEDARKARAERRAGADTRGDTAHGKRDSRRDGTRMGGRPALDFDAIDANRDGFLVRTEVTAHRDRMREQMRARGAERFAEAFTAADLNRDGRLSRVEVDEKMPRLARRFAWMDDNRDGFLSRAELESGKRR